MNKFFGTGTCRAVAVNAKSDPDRVSEWVQLLPAGLVTGRDGREWVNDRPDQILTAFAQGGMDLPVDVEHSTEMLAPEGHPAPAVGWIKALEDRAGEIWGRVHWTAAGEEAVGSGSYRYVSPVITYHKESRRVMAITSVGLTNRPNLYMSALNGREEDGKNMDLQKLLALCGLPETATYDDALAHVGKLKGDLATALNATPSLDKFVSRADYDQALARAANAEQRLAADARAAREKEIDAAINKALTDGKITPATVEYHRAQCAQDGGLERFAAYCQAAPVIGDASRVDGKRPEDAGKALNAEDRQVCAALGIDESEYRKVNNL